MADKTQTQDTKETALREMVDKEIEAHAGQLGRAPEKFLVYASEYMRLHSALALEKKLHFFFDTPEGTAAGVTDGTVSTAAQAPDLEKKPEKVTVPLEYMTKHGTTKIYPVRHRAILTEEEIQHIMEKFGPWYLDG